MQTFTSEDLALLETRYRATMLNSISGFKSLQMVATANEIGKTNIALFNSIFHIGANPFLIGMVCRPDGDQHETFYNIKNTGFYTLNNVRESFYKMAHQTSARYDVSESEFIECGFTEFYDTSFKAPFVAESSIKLGLQLKEIIDVKYNGSRIVIGEVKKIMIDDGLLADDGFIDLEKDSSITVSGLDSYYTVKHLSRLKYAKAHQEIEEIINLKSYGN